jgi:hypothetical protein
MQRQEQRRAGLILLPLVCLGTILDARPVGSRFVPSLALASPPLRSHGYGSVPLAFEPNLGQAPAEVQYLAHGSGYTLYLTQEGAYLSSSQETGAAGSGYRLTRRTTVTLDVVGGAVPARISAEGKRAGIVNYLIGSDRRKWRTRIPTYARVIYHDVYRGIDLVYRAGGDGLLEYDWTVRPHANPGVITMAVVGAQGLRLDREGNAVLEAGVATILERAPHVYQRAGGKCIAVHGRLRLGPGRRIGFALGRYDRSRTLVIDPSLAYATYLGSGPNINVGRVAVDSAGDAYIAGTVGSPASIPIKSAFQAGAAGGDYDAFVTKLNPSGSDLIYSTYLGGKGVDVAAGIAVDASGEAFVAGYTLSSDFPGFTAAAGFTRASFIVKLSGGGTQLIYSHVDSLHTSTADVALDAAGDAWYTGTDSTGAAGSEMFVEELDPGGNLHDSYTAGSGDTIGTSVAVNAQGMAYVAGWTSDPGFPVYKALNPKLSGKRDCFVMKYGAGAVQWATFLGGTSDDMCSGVAVDGSGYVYLAGGTQSSDFPTSNAFQDALKGSYDGFVTKLAPSGQSYVYSTYLGGHEANPNDTSQGVAADVQGDAYVVGTTSAADFSIANPIPGQTFQGQEAYVTKLSADGRSLIFSTFLGGAKGDYANGVAVDATGNAYVTGITQSADFPVTSGAFARYLSGSLVGFIAKLTEAAAATPTLTATPTSTTTATPPPTATATQTLAATVTATRVAPPEKPDIFLKASSVASGKKLKLTVVTSPNADVMATLTVKHAKSVLFKANASGVSDSSGVWKGSIMIGFNPADHAKAIVTVQARTAGGTATNSTKVTILHHG